MEFETLFWYQTFEIHAYETSWKAHVKCLQWKTMYGFQNFLHKNKLTFMPMPLIFKQYVFECTCACRLPYLQYKQHGYKRYRWL